jgi:hypothetical protein
MFPGPIILDSFLAYPPVDLFLKNQFGKIKFDELDFLSISNLIFTACVACKNQFRNPVCRTDFYNLIFQKIKYRFSYDALGCVSSRSSYITPKTLNFFKDGFIALFTNGNANIFAIFALHFSLDLALLQTKKKIGRKR